MRSIQKMLLAAALAALAVPAFSQSAPTGEGIQDRKENQQDRIANGVASGPLLERVPILRRRNPISTKKSVTCASWTTAI
jgi:hypothetical protein